MLVCFVGGVLDVWLLLQLDAHWEIHFNNNIYLYNNNIYINNNTSSLLFTINKYSQWLFPQMCSRILGRIRNSGDKYVYAARQGQQGWTARGRSRAMWVCNLAECFHFLLPEQASYGDPVTPSLSWPALNSVTTKQHS